MGKFVNFTNHNSALWCDKQKQEAQEYGKIIDIPFPAVSPFADEADILRMAGEYAGKILALHPAAVLCQGEYSLCYASANLLMLKNIAVLCACSERRVDERVLPDGKTEKMIAFEFVRFRKYFF